MTAKPERVDMRSSQDESDSTILTTGRYNTAK